MNTLTKILGLGAVALALTGCGERKLVEPQRENYQRSNIIDLNQNVWYVERDTNGIISEFRYVSNAGAALNMSFIDSKISKYPSRVIDGRVYELTPKLKNAIEQELETKKELEYQMDKAAYDTLKLKQSQTNEVKQEKSNYRAIVGSGSDGSIMVEKLNLDKNQQ